EKQIRGDIKRWRQSKILINCLNPEIPGLVRRGESDRVTVEKNFPLIMLKRARKNLYQSGLTRSVVANECGDLASFGNKISVLERHDMPETAADISHFNYRLSTHESWRGGSG